MIAMTNKHILLQRYGLWKDAEDISADYDSVGQKISPTASPSKELEVYRI